MRLHFRSLESQETTSMEVPYFFSFHQLLRSVSFNIFGSSSGYEIQLSLDGKDRIIPRSPDDTLQSIGINSGDLIYYYATQTQTLAASSSCSNLNDVSVDSHETDSVMEEEEGHIDYTETGKTADQSVNSEPYCLIRKVLREELGTDLSPHNLIRVAVHAVFLESGFIPFDVDGFHVSKGLPNCSNASKCLSYTLPRLLPSDKPEFVVIKFQSLGDLIIVYGCFSTKIGSSTSYRVCLNEASLAPTLYSLPSASDKHDEKQVTEFWISVKDGLALPLLINVCDETGLVPPACLMRLPTELKLKILEGLSAVDIARMGCICREMRDVSSNDDMWKHKFAKEFGPWESLISKGIVNWKKRFATRWVDRKNLNKKQPQRGLFGCPWPKTVPNPGPNLFSPCILVGIPTISNLLQPYL